MSTRFRNAFLMAFLAACIAAPASAGDWPQWGGPQRNFTADCQGLADKWPEEGPKTLWSVKIGDGYAAVLVDGDSLYTMNREGDQEAIVCLSAADGSQRWRYEYAAPFIAEKMQMEFGPGPHATPLVAGDRLFGVGVTGKFHCFDKRTGKVLWSHDFIEEYGAEPMGRGYSSSPLAYKDTVIVPVGGKEDGQTIFAFKQDDGTVVFSGGNFDVSHSSPIVVNVDGQDQLLCFLAGPKGASADAGPSTKPSGEIVGLDPTSGAVLWQYEHPAQFGANITTPLWVGDNRVFITSAYNGGSRLLKLSRDADGKTSVKELWHTRKVQGHHSTAVLQDGIIYTSSGSFGPAFVAAIEADSGEILWRKRGYAKANCLLADGKLILLDQDGKLVLARPTRADLEILSECQPLKSVAWTVPTLAGDRLYVRDRATLMAMDISG